MHDQRVKPEPFAEAELEAARALRLELADILPKDYDTDFSLARWHRAYNGDKDKIRQKLGELIGHRRMLGYSTENIVERCTSVDMAKKTFERFAISHLSQKVLSDDVVVFVQKMDGADIKEIMKVMPLSYVLHSYYMLHESFQRAMLEHEARTGRPSGVVIVLDLRGMICKDFLNPLGTCSTLARLVVKIWSEYFSENMIKLLLLHPPGLMSIMWQIAKQIVDAKTQSRISFVQKNEDLFNYLSPEAIPEEFGGKRRDDSGFAATPESCCRIPLPVNEEEHFKMDKFWKEHGFSSVPDLKTISIKPKTAHEVTKECRVGQKLLWQFTVNAEITFEIDRVDKEDPRQSQAVWPRIALTSLKVPEHGFIEIAEPGTYQLRFADVSSAWLSSKLQYTVQLK